MALPILVASIVENEYVHSLSTNANCDGVRGNLRQLGGRYLYIEQRNNPSASVVRNVHFTGNLQQAPQPLHDPVRLL